VLQVLLNAENNFVTDHAPFLQPKSICCRLVGKLTEEYTKGFAQFCVSEAKSYDDLIKVFLAIFLKFLE